jgi:hypothetical protein
MEIVLLSFLALAIICITIASPDSKKKPGGGAGRGKLTRYKSMIG